MKYAISTALLALCLALGVTLFSPVETQTPAEAVPVTQVAFELPALDAANTLLTTDDAGAFGECRRECTKGVPDSQDCIDGCPACFISTCGEYRAQFD